MSIRSWSTGVALAMALGAQIQTPAVAQEVTFRFSSGAPELTVKGQSANKLAKLVKEYTNGEVDVVVYHGGQLIPDPEELRAVSRGQVDLAAPYTSYFAAIDPIWDVFYQPMLFKNVEHAVQVFAGSVGQNLLQTLKARGLEPLSIWHDGPVYLFTTDVPVTKPDEMRGRSVRVVFTRSLEMTLERLNSTPITTTAGEVYLALQQGVMNSVLTTPTYAGPAKWGEVLKTGTRMMWGHGGYVLIMNPKSLGKLSDSQREGFMRAVRETQQWNQVEALANIKQAEGNLAKGGLQWHDITDAERQLWVDAVSGVWTAHGDGITKLVGEIRKGH